MNMQVSNTEVTIPEKVFRIGIFADVHARDDRLFELLNQNPDIKLWFCVGDAIDMFAPKWDNAPTLRMLVKYNIKSIIGNHEAYIKANKEKLKMFEGETESIKYLMKMPFSIDVLFAGYKLKLFHATPIGANEYIAVDASDDDYKKIFEHLKCDIVVLGHAHVYFDKQIGSKRFINPGALSSAEPTFIVFEKDGNILKHKLNID